MIKFNRQSDYALVLATELAIDHKKGNWVPLSVVADKYNLSVKFLGSVAGILRKKGLILSKEGTGGGYALAQDPREIMIGDILYATLTDSAPSLCTSSIGCVNEKKCPAKPVWGVVQGVLEEVLFSISLKSLLKIK
ncbi:Rrf2 family transcriptional regulator [Candidatus Microgenomates bacterium]|nr:Rrf2 family transcriptional regulator [Candidatus Microgenomates bacterium]